MFLLVNLRVLPIAGKLRDLWRCLHYPRTCSTINPNVAMIFILSNPVNGRSYKRSRRLTATGWLQRFDFHRPGWGQGLQAVKKNMQQFHSRCEWCDWPMRLTFHIDLSKDFWWNGHVCTCLRSRNVLACLVGWILTDLAKNKNFLTQFYTINSRLWKFRIYCFFIDACKVLKTRQGSRS